MIFAKTALYSGVGAAVASLAVIQFLAKLEGKAAVEPINATSHVIYGASHKPEPSLSFHETLPGGLINVGSAFFWGGVFARIAPSRNSLRAIVARSSLTVAFAAVLDYGIVPRRLSPGWEHSLTPRSVAFSLATMGVGLALGALAAQT